MRVSDPEGKNKTLLVCFWRIGKVEGTHWNVIDCWTEDGAELAKIWSRAQAHWASSLTLHKTGSGSTVLESQHYSTWEAEVKVTLCHILRWKSAQKTEILSQSNRIKIQLIAIGVVLGLRACRRTRLLGGNGLPLEEGGCHPKSRLLKSSLA